MDLNFPFEAIWDDHDYGLNDGGKNYAFKKQAKELFLDFWDIPLDDVRRLRQGLYYDVLKNIDDFVAPVNNSFQAKFCINLKNQATSCSF